MTNFNGKKRKFLKPVEFAVAALLSISMPASAAIGPNGNDTQSNTSTANTISQANQVKQKQLLIKPSDQKNKQHLAGHYSHYSHGSHSSHSSHSSHYSSSR